MESPSHVLLVEGQDDEHVVRHIRERHSSLPSFAILPKDNVEQLLESIEVETMVSGRQVLGILVDANTDVSARWNAVTHRLRNANLDADLPATPNSEGIIIDGVPRIGIWLMPDNKSEGELEDFVAQMIPADDPVWPLAQRYIECIPACDRKFTEKKIARAKVHAWLAARKEPRKMGVAIRAHDLEINGVICCKFIEWLSKLFS